MQEIENKDIAFDDLKTYMTHSQVQNLHAKAFMETFDIIYKFVINGSNRHVEDATDNLAWVCNSAMGTGKTTALKVILKMLTSEKTQIPLLLVFNNTDTMESVYKEINDFAMNYGIRDLIEKIDAENRYSKEEDIKHYKYVCITQQRLRNLVLNIGNKVNYLFYENRQALSWGTVPIQMTKRLIIVDEMPIFFDMCVFNLANPIDWFDKLVEQSSNDLSIGRIIISLLIATELLLNQDSLTLKLRRHIEGSQYETIFKDILQKISEERGTPELVLKYRWFKRLYNSENVGQIDRGTKASSILCSQRIDYRELGSILIMDGTSQCTRSIYNDEYEFKTISNYHDYSRIILHWQDINTSLNGTKENKQGIEGAIAQNLSKIRTEDGINPFPLMAKVDIEVFLKNGVITEEQSKYFKKELNDEEMPLNLLNTTGKNALEKMNALALLRLPIRNPQYYKLIAMGLSQGELELRLTKDFLEAIKGKENLSESSSIVMEKLKTSDWFAERKINEVFEEIVLSDLLQIIHRSSIRRINKKNPVHIYLYTDRKEWIERVRKSLEYPPQIYEKILNTSLYRFADYCNEWADKSVDYVRTYSKLDGEFFSPNQIGGKKFTDWLSRNMKAQEKKDYIRNVFNQHGLIVFQGENRYWRIGLEQ